MFEKNWFHSKKYQFESDGNILRLQIYFHLFVLKLDLKPIEMHQVS